MTSPFSNSIKSVVISLVMFTMTFQVHGAEDPLQFDWPQSWTVFGPFNDNTSMAPAESLKKIPMSITLKENTVQAIQVQQKKHTLDFIKVFAKDGVDHPIQVGEKAIIFAKIKVNASGELYAGAGADWWMKWMIDGKEVMSTMETGNGRAPYSFTNHVIRTQLTPGEHVISAVVKSGSNGWKLISHGGEESVWKALDKAEVDKASVKNRIAEREMRIQRNSRLKIVMFGSSVAYGYGATDMFGWGNRLGERLKKRNWNYVNKSIGGDNTSLILSRIDEDLLAEDPDVMILGLSLANEGIQGGNKGKTYQGFIRNMKKIIQICRQNDIIPVIANCYPNKSYKKNHYQYVKKFNEDLSNWSVYSIDLMGAIDNGLGQWVEGYYKDAGHPNDLGHEEMTRSVPVSVFDSLISSELESIIPTPSWSQSIAEAKCVWSCMADRPLHSNTIGFEIRWSEKTKPTTLTALGPWILECDRDGYLICREGKKKLSSSKTLKLKRDGEFGTAQIALSYSYGRQTLTLFLDGETVDFTVGHHEIEQFQLTSVKEDLQYRNAFWYYAAQTSSQLDSMFETKRISKSSLALYAPLDDQVLADEAPLLNLAPTELGFVQVR
jgi:lysophospholipase L1-like esterase